MDVSVSPLIFNDSILARGRKNRHLQGNISRLQYRSENVNDTIAENFLTAALKLLLAYQV